MAKFGHLHIKRHTKGTSNELSLDVLDAKRDELDARKDRKNTMSFMLDFRRKPGDGRGSDASAMRGDAVAVSAVRSAGAHRGSPAVALPRGTRWGRGRAKALSKVPSSVPGNPLIPVDEVLRRKRARHKSTVRKYVLGFGAIAVAAAVAVFFGMNAYRAQQEFGGQFRTVVDAVSASDAYLVEIDAAMNDPLGSTTPEERALLRKEAVAVTSAADNTLAEAARLAADAPAEQDKVALEQLEDGARGRKNMVGLAMEAFGIADAASTAETTATSAWDLVISADVAARDALSRANSATTTSALAETTTVLQQSSGEFGAALQQLRGLEATVEGVDLSAHEAYIEKRIETLGFAIATNEALAAGDRATAAAQNELYDAGDRESADMAERLPVSIGSVVDAAFTDAVLDAQSRYDKERDRVSVADSRVRSYLGI